MVYNREIIQLYIGQAGVQIASACWELFCLEHGILVDGSTNDNCDPDLTAFFSLKNHKLLKNSACCSKHALSLSDNKCSPRVVLVDSEPTPIDEIRTGCYNRLFDPSTLITGKEDAASNFARGFYKVGREMKSATLESIRQQAEICDNLQGFSTFRSLSGGTGVGFGSLLARSLSDDYPKIRKVEFNIFPSPRISTITVEPYNAILAAHRSMEHTDCSIMFDNEALYKVCEKNLNVEDQTYTNINRIVAQVVSSCNFSMRFSIDQLVTNLVPFPRVHYAIVNYAPLLPAVSGSYANVTEDQITQSCFQPGNELLSCDPRSGQYISCCMLYRGNVDASSINRAIHEIKENKQIKFVDWSPTSFKLGVNYQPPAYVPGGDLSYVDRALCMLSNNSTIKSAWNRIYKNYKMMYEKNAFLHHYMAEGLEKTELSEAAENVCDLIMDYEEVDKMT